MSKQDKLKKMIPINASAEVLHEMISELVGLIADEDHEAATAHCDEIINQIKEFQKDLRLEKL